MDLSKRLSECFIFLYFKVSFFNQKNIFFMKYNILFKNKTRVLLLIRITTMNYQSLYLLFINITFNSQCYIVHYHFTGL